MITWLIRSGAWLTSLNVYLIASLIWYLRVISIFRWIISSGCCSSISSSIVSKCCRRSVGIILSCDSCCGLICSSRSWFVTWLLLCITILPICISTWWLIVGTLIVVKVAHYFIFYYNYFLEIIWISFYFFLGLIKKAIKLRFQ